MVSRLIRFGTCDRLFVLLAWLASLAALLSLGSRHVLWQQTSGTVIGHSKETVCSSQTGRNCRESYYPQISFQASSTNGTFTFVSRHKGSLNNFPEGAEVDILYNPWSPQKAETLQQSIRETQIAAYVASATTVAFVAVVGVFVYHNPSLKRTMADTVDGRDFV